MGNEELFRDEPVWNAIFSLAIPSVLTILFGILLTVSMLLGTDFILRYLGATEDMTGFASAYMRTLAFGFSLMLFGIVMASVVRVESNMAGTITKGI